MNSWHLTIFCLLHLNFVFGGKTWTVLQYEGVDELYLQTRLKPDRLNPNYAMLKGLCASLIRNPSFNAVVKIGRKFQSSIRGEVKRVDFMPTYIPNNGWRRYVWKTPNYHFITDTYVCASPGDDSTYILSHGYENDHLFFLFAYDDKANVLQLAASIHEEVVPMRWKTRSSFMKNRKAYIDNVLKKSLKIQEVFKDEDSVCGLNMVDKLRLCALVLSSSYYQSRYESPVKATPKVSECEEVSLVGKNNRKIVSESMYRCLTKTSNIPSENGAIYISRNYEDYEVNSYKLVGEDDGVKMVKFEKTFKNIFFVEEPYTKDGTMKAGYKLRGKTEQDTAVHEVYKTEVELQSVPRTLSTKLPNTEDSSSAVHYDRDKKTLNVEISPSAEGGNRDNKTLDTEISASAVPEGRSNKLHNTEALSSVVLDDRDNEALNSEILEVHEGGDKELPSTELSFSALHDGRENEFQNTEVSFSGVLENGDKKVPNAEASSSAVYSDKDMKNVICEEASPSTPVTIVHEWDADVTSIK